MTVLEDVDLEGRFVSIGGEIKYVRHGRVRHVGTVESYQSYFLAEPIIPVAAEQLNYLRPGPIIPSKWSRTNWIEGNANTYLDMRELMVSVAKGKGIEIGAGPHALRVPLDCAVTYVDVFEMDDQLERMWPGYDSRSVMAVDVKDSFEQLQLFEDGSQDFVMASHVIEHVANPILAIRQSFRCLKPGGFLFLVVPDKRYTFDLGRQETSIEHLMNDYRSPDRNRDFQHYLEYYKIAAQLPDFLSKAKQEFDLGRDIHYHVWTVETFYDLMISLKEEGITPWSELWWQPKVSAQSDAVEFYFALRKAWRS